MNRGEMHAQKRAELFVAQEKQVWSTPVSYTHLDVYKRQFRNRISNPFSAGRC